ncbi:MAG TPA: pyridoxamine 5'-phosphate oxidase family protein [Chloroflexota bacterium]|nr:pyridoxamine 5'-phosphate oxidase family protein [Chloroflexota bacterium]
MSPTERTKVRRHPERGAYDAETIHAILDAGFLCHVGFVDEGQPYVIPTLYCRSGDTLYLHGSSLSRMAQRLQAGIALCVTVTHVDGIVVARSGFNSSINYRSVMVLGTGRLVEDRADKLAAMNALIDGVVPGRAADMRPPTTKELNATAIIAIRIDEASAKVRTGPPKDPAKDRRLDLWAGVIPAAFQVGEPEDSPDLGAGIDVPEYVRRFIDGADT